MFLALTFTIGSWAVAHFSVKLETQMLRMFYGIFLVILGFIILFDELLKKKKI